MVKVGGEIDTFCNRCELTLAHTVIAVMGGKPVKVECNTCHSVHRWRDGGGRGAGPASGGGARAARPKATEGFDALLASKRAAPTAYSPKRLYSVDDVVDHPIFGRGFVSALRDGGKIEVTFRSDVKLLVHGRE
jgi:hypothetical protein